MSNKVLRNNRTIHNNDPEPEPGSNTPANKTLWKLSAGDPNRTRIATSGNAYPQLPETSALGLHQPIMAFIPIATVSMNLHL